MALYIYTANSSLKELLLASVEKYRDTDSGFDIPMLEQTVDSFIPKHSFDLGIVVASNDAQSRPTPCLLLPRSSLSNTPFRLANSIGLIDMGYRGIVQARVDVQITGGEGPVDISHGARLFQICKHDFMPWVHINIVDTFEDLPAAPDNRGIGGFGSTG
jgi:dUTP pyrophosphatase